jgi:O-methyltransferase involved in polyketide biosynthesis
MKDIQFSDISETLLIPLYARAIESKSENPILIDKKAIEITNQLNSVFSKSESKLHRNLSKGKLRRKLDVTLSMRTKKFDEYVKEFLKKSPDGIVVEIGCGLSTRFERIDNEKVIWYDLDFPDVIDIRKYFFKENNRYHFIESSALEFNWLNKLDNKKGKNILFIAEGVFMYLFENDVKSLILKIQENFTNCELAF